MATFKWQRVEHRSSAVVLRFGVLALTLSTAAIHASLGGFLFTMNAIGYTALALAMIVPGPLARVRWLVRLALVGFTLATIGGWLLVGARFPLAYVDKALELALVAFVVLDLQVSDGGPNAVAGRSRELLNSLVRGFAARLRP